MGLVLDAAIEDELRIRQLQVVDATRASLGLPVVEYIVTDAPLQVSTYYATKFINGLNLNFPIIWPLLERA